MDGRIEFMEKDKLAIIVEDIMFDYAGSVNSDTVWRQVQWRIEQALDGMYLDLEVVCDERNNSESDSAVTVTVYFKENEEEGFQKTSFTLTGVIAERRYSDHENDDGEIEDFDGFPFTKFKIVVPTEQDKKDIILASQHIHDADVDTDIIPVNQIAHIYDTYGKKDYPEIVVNEELYNKLSKQ